MDNESIYTVTEVVDSLIPPGVNSMGEWLDSLSEIEFSDIYRLCVKRPEERSGQDEYQICRHSIAIYCKELELTELGLSSEFMKKITSSFCLKVIAEGLGREGMLELQRPLMLYK